MTLLRNCFWPRVCNALRHSVALHQWLVVQPARRTSAWTLCQRGATSHLQISKWSFFKWFLLALNCHKVKPSVLFTMIQKWQQMLRYKMMCSLQALTFVPRKFQRSLVAKTAFQCHRFAINRRFIHQRQRDMGQELRCVFCKNCVKQTQNDRHFNGGSWSGICCAKRWSFHCLD